MKFERLRKNREFRLVYRRGRSNATSLLVLYKFKNNRNKIDGVPFNKVGVSVSKKVGKSVVRSRVKRLVLESLRALPETESLGYDLVFVARNAIADQSYWEVLDSVRTLLKKAGMINEKDTN